jgi:N-formylglutamate amidohydrolase
LEQFGKQRDDCHSFPQIPIIRALEKSDFRPDFNIGTDAFHTKLIDLSIAFSMKVFLRSG